MKNVDIPLILGGLFLATSQALIDAIDARLLLRVGKEEVVFKLPKTMKHPLEFDDALFSLDNTNYIAYNCVQ